MQGVRAMLRNSEEVASLLQDWRHVDTDSMVLEAQQSGSSCGEDLFRECKYMCTMVHGMNHVSGNIIYSDSGT